MRIHIVGTILLALCTAAFGGTKWTHSIEEGEDATSTHHYFWFSNGSTVEKIRWVHYGGAGRATVIDYVLGTGFIRIKKMTSDRGSIPDLAAGRDAKFETTTDYTLTCKDSGHMLLLPDPNKRLSASQRLDLWNLIWLLSREDKQPINKSAEQDVGGKRGGG